ncbi:MAG: hypothetical protein U0795_15500 [Pirellulales bacterium]
MNNPKVPTERKVSIGRIVSCAVVLTLWILVYAVGLLVESTAYRLVLAPMAVSEQIPPTQVEVLLKHFSTQSPKTAAPKTDATPGSAADESKAPQQRAALALAMMDSTQPIPAWQAFIVSIASFIPVNLALLALLSGYLGGVASNLTINSMSENRRMAYAKSHPHRIDFLQEPPISACLRGFVVFMCVIAGLYIGMDDPFKNPTPGQYMRLAGLLSIMAFIVGYDASRLQEWLSIIPGPGGNSGNHH